MAVRDDWQAKGVGTVLVQAAIDLAEKWLNISRIELDVFADNDPAIRLYQKFGFKTEGRRVGYGLRDGLMVDTYAMARLRSPTK
jgi:putative acetyltransferase